MNTKGLPPFGPLAALQFLTRIPISLRSAPDMHTTVAWFPLAGALIGAAIGGVGAALWHVLPALPAAALTIAFGLLLTGAFHEDGLGDVADAFGGGATVERRLEILKDSRHGTYGVAAMCTSILVRVACLGSFGSPKDVFVSSVAAHAIGRASAVALAGAGPMSTHAGLGADAGRATTPRRALVGAVGAVGVTWIAVGAWTPWLVLAGAVAAALTGVLAHRKVGGVGGDVLGACEQVAECAVLVVCSGLSA